MKVSELEGAQLDYWVAKAMGREVEIIDQGDNPCSPRYYARFKSTGAVWWPSTHWAQGGPIIERELIEVHPRSDCGLGPHWGAVPSLDDQEVWEQFQRGPTPLVAAMRTYVCSKFGDEVPEEVPEAR